MTDYSAVCGKYAELIQVQGERSSSTAVTNLRCFSGDVIVETNGPTFSAANLINCAGLYSDRICRMAGEKPDVTIVPCSRRVLRSVPERASLIRSLIYPSRSALSFSRGYFTRRINEQWMPGPMRFGLSPRRLPAQGFQSNEFAGALHFLDSGDGCQELESGVAEFHRSFSKQAFVRALQRLLPEVREEDLVPAARECAPRR